MPPKMGWRVLKKIDVCVYKYKRHYTKQIMKRMLIRYGGDRCVYQKENMTKVETNE